MLLGGWVLLLAADQTRLGGLSAASAGVCLVLAVAAACSAKVDNARLQGPLYAHGSMFIAIGVVVMIAGD